MYAIDSIDPAEFREAVHNNNPYKPLYVKFKLVWTCNLRCVMCNHWRDRRAAPLKIERLRPIIDELAALGCRKIHVSGGEPTLHPDLDDFIAHATQNGMRVTMTTNATLIDKARARALADAGLHGANVSIDSPEKRLHEKIRGVKGSYKTTVRGLEYLSRYLPRVRINTVVTRTNYQSLVDLPDLAAERGASSINLIPVDIHTPDVRPLAARHLIDYNRNVAPVIAEKALTYGLIKHRRAAYPFGVTREDMQRSKRAEYGQTYYSTHRCYAPWTHALIDHVGQVMICCMLRENPILGDLREQTFTEIWTGEAFRKLRQRANLAEPLYPACNGCDMFIRRNKQLDAMV